MRQPKSIKMLVVCMLLCSLQGVFSQSLQQPDAEDRPTQRWLPLPQGDEIDLSKQAQLLQQLRDLMSSESKSASGDLSLPKLPLPKLTEQQLREMEKALDDVREQIGEDKLPNLENIPKEWIDQALSDPVVRKQAEQLLEQYARDRKFPTPNNRTPLNSDGVPFPRRQPSDKTSNPNSKSNVKPSPNSKSNSNSKSKSQDTDSGGLSPSVQTPSQQLPNENASKRQGPNGKSPNAEMPQAEQPLASDELQGSKPSGDEKSEVPPMRPLPSRPDAERIEALQDLFKKLKTIEGQRQSQKNVPKSDSRSSSSRNSSQGNINHGNTNQGNNQSTKPNSSGRQPAPTMPRSSRNSPKPSLPSAERNPNDSLDSQSSAESPNADSSNDPKIIPNPFEPDSETPNSDQADSDQADSGTAPSKSALPEGSSKPSNRRPTQGSRPGTSPNGNGSNSLDRTPLTWPPSPVENNKAPRGSNSSSPDMDIKTQLERHGLGSALQSIVQKTLKEQGESGSANERKNNKGSIAQSKSKDNKSGSKASSPTSPSNKATATNSSASKQESLKPIENATSESAKNVARVTPTPSGSQNSNTASTMTGLRNIAAQFWGAIRSTPGEGGGGGSSASTKNAAGGSLSEYGYSWSGQGWLLLVLALIGIAMLLLLARKRIELATATREAEAELAKEILTEGIRTRADVVRAFHRFVLRRAQPVANWWNHRYVATRLTEASPQLRSVISDLASVYEHARYLPPEVALSSEELDRVQAALKQCAACGV